MGRAVGWAARAHRACGCWLLTATADPASLRLGEHLHPTVRDAEADRGADELEPALLCPFGYGDWQNEISPVRVALSAPAGLRRQAARGRALEHPKVHLADRGIQGHAACQSGSAARHQEAPAQAARGS